MLTLLFWVPLADAVRKPTNRERAKIEDALDAAPFCLECPRTIVVSTVDERWAAAYIEETAERHGGTASLKLINRHWRVQQVGTGGGCGVPRRVAADLKLSCERLDQPPSTRPAPEPNERGSKP